MENKSSVIPVIILLIAAILGYMVIYAPLTSKKSVLESGLAEIKQKNELLANIKQVSVKIKNNENVISKRKDESWLINKISSIANEAKVNVVSVEPQRKISVGDYEKISVKVDLVCSYHRLGRFISRLENSPELLKIDSLEAKKELEKESAASEGTPQAVKRPKGENLLQVILMVSTYNVK